MALSPIAQADDRVVVNADEAQPSVTYEIDLNTGLLGGLIDGEAAVRQFVNKVIITPRFRFLIYDDTYGSELDDIIGQDVPDELLQTEIPRIITEAIAGDERIEDVTNFTLERAGDQLRVSFSVIIAEGVVDMEVTI